ncbi:unnamed protein product [Soboliphyme baturini]|uniref:Fucosyltransferase n=1 Tax=Soboliphyme baturini TaxID=241478 RepID=A0A183IHU8_9BILA|nr:unnamed protein product [Soboliphyme baturini]
MVTIFEQNISPFRSKRYKLENQALVVILDWTFFFSTPLESFINSSIHRCPTTICQVTSDKTLLNSSHVVFFHERNFDPMDLPNYRHPSQLFVIANWEAPLHISGSTAFIEHNFFNLTMTYRRDSDIFSPYMLVEKNKNVLQQNDEQLTKLAKGKTKHIAWFVSNCHTSSGRELYVKQLQKYIAVDIYGGCGPLRCSRENGSCTDMLKNDYRFYLSFENAICLDYVTEKVTTALSTYVMPIVLSRAIAEPLLPEGSFVAVDDFESPKLLAEFLYKLGNDTTWYITYFKYKLEYTVRDEPWTTRICSLCEQFSRNRQPFIRHVKNFQKWFTQNGDCAPIFIADERN